MTSEPIRDPLIDHLLTPQNSALVVIDYQPFQFEVVTSMDRDLLVRNIVSVARLAKIFGLPIVLSTVGVAASGREPPSPSSRRCWPTAARSIGRRSTPGRTPSSARRMQGTSSTLKEEIRFAGGKVLNSSFAEHGPARSLEVPSVGVVFVEDRTLAPGGIGEPAVGGVSAAVSNAIYDAVGVRVRDLPFRPDRVLGALQTRATAQG